MDLFHLSYGALLKVQGYDYLESEKYPNIARWVLFAFGYLYHSDGDYLRWWKDIASRPAWQKVYALN